MHDNQPMLAPDAMPQDGGPRVQVVSRTQTRVRETVLHAHGQGQLLGSAQGALTVLCDAAWLVVPAGFAIWLPPGLPHAVRSQQPFSGWAVYVAPAACAPLPDAVCVCALSALLRAATTRLADDGLPVARRPALETVILDEMADLTPAPLYLPLPQDPRARRVACALLADPASARSMAAWAREAGLSVRSLSRHFATTGFGFAAWRQRARLLQAIEGLASGQPVTRVALDAGYDSASSFSRLFRRALGCAPSVYAAEPSA